MRRVYEWRSSGPSRIPNYDTHSYWSFYDLTTNGTFLVSLKGYVVILLEILVMCVIIFIGIYRTARLWSCRLHQIGLAVYMTQPSGINRIL
jgi:hypothetical protein